VIVVHLLDADLREELLALIIAQEKGIEAMTMATDQPIASAPAELDHRQ
jgi:hypothetical protein